MRVALIAMLAVALAQGGCRSSTEPAGLLVITKVAPAAFRPGTEVTVSMTVINAGFGPRVIETNWCNGFRVTTTSGRVVGPALRDCDGSSNPHVLLPGERMVFKRTWTGNGLGETTNTTSPLPPGQYLVQTGIDLTTATGHPPTGPSHVESTPVAITLIP